MLLYVLIIYLATITPVAVYWIERSYRGDIFSAQSTHCNYYNSRCTTESTGLLWSDCTECQCYDGSTIYRDYCHGDVSRDFLGKLKERLQYSPVQISVILFSVTHGCSVYWQVTQFIITANFKNILWDKNW